ncbi:MAG: YfiH family protein [Kiritimatiellia bacterium]|jgi:YfiH family protein
MAVPLLTGTSLLEMRGVVHGFTTRAGGVSTGSRSSLNLALGRGSDRALVRENWRRTAQSLGQGWSEEDLVLVDQVHGADVLKVRAATGPWATAGAADAVVCTDKRLLLAVRTADCVPVLLAAPGGVAAAHAGWRGLVAGVLPATVRSLCDAAGVAPSDVVAVVGPHIGVDAYEVGPDVVRALIDAGLRRHRVCKMGPTGREHADLGHAAEDQLYAAGVGRVERLGVCTHSDSRFYSYRREGTSTGRLAAVIGMSA